MNLFDVHARFPDQEARIAHLERVRFGDDPYCPLCGVFGECARKAEGDLVGRWNCHACKSSFNVLSGTIFQGTHLPLKLWFGAVALVLNAKKSLSSRQLARDLDMNQRSAWYMLQRIRSEMATKQGRVLLKGIVEADETYVGGRSRKRNRKGKKKDGSSGSSGKVKRGRGTKKTAVIGAVERGGKVVAQVAGDLSGSGVLAFIRRALDPSKTETVVTDEYRSYKVVRKIVSHAVKWRL